MKCVNGDGRPTVRTTKGRGSKVMCEECFAELSAKMLSLDRPR